MIGEKKTPRADHPPSSRQGRDRSSMRDKEFTWTPAFAGETNQKFTSMNHATTRSSVVKLNPPSPKSTRTVSFAPNLLSKIILDNGFSSCC